MALFRSFLDFKKKTAKKYPFRAWGTILTKNTHVQTFCHFSNDLNSNHDDMKADPIFTPTKNPLCDHLGLKKYSFKINLTNWEKKIWNELILFTIYSKNKCGNFNPNVKISLTLDADILNSIVKHCANPNPSATLLLPEGFKECMSMHPLWNSQQLILWKVLGSSSKYISTKKKLFVGIALSWKKRFGHWPRLPPTPDSGGKY